MSPMQVYRSKPQGGVYKRGRLQVLWMRDVKVGDVLLDPWGNERIVRNVVRYSNGDLHSLNFIKRRCSKFRRAGTIYLYTELRLGGWKPTGVTMPLGTEFDLLVEAEIKTAPFPILLTCCEARGVA
jgi:hypothetical protein